MPAVVLLDRTEFFVKSAPRMDLQSPLKQACQSLNDFENKCNSLWSTIQQLTFQKVVYCKLSSLWSSATAC